MCVEKELWLRSCPSCTRFVEEDACDQHPVPTSSEAASAGLVPINLTRAILLFEQRFVGYDDGLHGC